MSESRHDINAESSNIHESATTPNSTRAETARDAAPNPTPDHLLNPHPDPWEDTETAHLRAFLKLTPTERFHLLMQAIEFMHMLRPPPHEVAKDDSIACDRQDSPRDTDAAGRA